MLNNRLLGIVCASTLILALTPEVNAANIYFNGFETDIGGWYTPTRVASGTNGITSAAGSFHATSGAGDYTDFGGYNFGAGSVPTVFQEFTTTLDIYIDVNGGFANDTRFDWDVAISNSSAGTHLRDFVFNAGFYDSNDAGIPGAGTDRFIISASNNSSPGSAYPKNPGKDPVAISTTGWYTFQHTFYDDGGVLAVDMSIFDSSSNLIKTWTLSDPADLIGLVGGSRYGWFSDNDFSALAFDNASLSTAAVPAPAAVWLFGSSLGLLGWVRRRTLRLDA